MWHTRASRWFGEIDLTEFIYLRILIRRNVPCILNFRLPRRHTTCVTPKKKWERQTKTRNSNIAGTRSQPRANNKNVELCSSILDGVVARRIKSSSLRSNHRECCTNSIKARTDNPELARGEAQSTFWETKEHTSVDVTANEELENKGRAIDRKNAVAAACLP